MKNSPRFTIIIPTRERADVLKYCLLSACAQDYPDLEIIVSDNCSADNTKAVVERFKDKRIRYLNTGKRLSMSHNWEFALAHVEHGWVTILGDDDAILPGALQRMAKIIQETGTQAIRCNGCNFTWPGVLDRPFGSISVSLKKGYSRLKSQDVLSQVINGEAHYTTLPMLYNGGFIDIELIKKAKSITKDFYLSMTPDVYSAVAFSHIVDSYIYSHEPHAINGASKHSGGTSAFSPKKEVPNSHDPAFIFWKEPNIPFHRDLPLLDDGSSLASIQVIVYEAYLQSLPLAKRKDINANHQRQLELIMRTTGPGDDGLVSWVTKFCAQHQLEMPALANFDARPRDFEHVKRVLRNRISQLYDFEIVGNEELPIRNVFEASLVAATIKITKEGITPNWSRQLSKQVASIYGRFHNNKQA